MPNGYDPQKGQILVPFDLKRDVVEPLGALHEGVTSLNERFEAHLTQVEVSIKTRMEPLATFIEDEMKEKAERKRKSAQMRKIMWWSIAVGGPLLAAAIGRIMGLPI